MGILSEFVTNLQYYYLAYKKKRKNNLFNIHKCCCEDCEGCEHEEGCAQPEQEDYTEEINRSLDRIRYLIDDDYIGDYEEDCLDCYCEADDEDIEYEGCEGD